MTFARHFVFLALVILLLAGTSSAQVGTPVATGMPPFGSFGGGPDVINLANLNAHLTIPVLHKAGRGLPFTYDLVYDTSVWYPVTSGGTKSWQPVNNWGWAGQTQVTTGYVSSNSSLQICYTNNRPTGSLITYSSFVYHDAFGASHPYIGTARFGSGSCAMYTQGLTETTKDGSGYTINYVPGLMGTLTITSPGGQFYQTPAMTLSTGSGTATDANGNQISVNSSGVFTDTLGTTVLTVSQNSPSPSNPTTLTYTAPSGATLFDFSGNGSGVRAGVSYSFGAEFTPNWD